MGSQVAAVVPDPAVAGLAHTSMTEWTIKYDELQRQTLVALLCRKVPITNNH